MSSQQQRDGFGDVAYRSPTIDPDARTREVIELDILGGSLIKIGCRLVGEPMR